jgi:alanine dehydrogenase
LTSATLPFIIDLAEQGPSASMKTNEHLRHGLNILRGQVTHKFVADALGKTFTSPDDALQ